MHGIDFSGGGNVGGGYIKIPVCEKDNYNNKNGDFISRFVHNEKIKKKKTADALFACNVHFEISTQRRKVFNIPFVES